MILIWTDSTTLLAHGFALQGAHPNDYSMLNLLHEFASFGGVEAAFNAAESRVAGGAQSLSIAIAKTLDPALRLNWPVTRIATTEHGVVVEGALWDSSWQGRSLLRCRSMS